MDAAQEVVELVNLWCPPGFDYEHPASRALRALMEANACAADQKRVLNGEQPIRPLDTYPIYKA